MCYIADFLVNLFYNIEQLQYACPAISAFKIKKLQLQYIKIALIISMHCKASRYSCDRIGDKYIFK